MEAISTNIGLTILIRKIGSAPDLEPVGFEPVREWQLSEGVLEQPIGRPKWPLDFTSEKNDQSDFKAGVSLFGVCTVGGSFGHGWESPKPRLRVTDLNGDGLSDRVWATKAGEVRVALGRIDQAGWFHGPGGPQNEQRVNVAGISEIEAQDAVASSTGVNISCTLIPLVQFGAGGSVSLRMASASATLLDVDGDHRVDLLSGGWFYRGLPHVCRDGTRPASPETHCADGLPVCSDPSLLCFAAERELQDFRPIEKCTIVPRRPGSTSTHSEIKQRAIYRGIG